MLAAWVAAATPVRAQTPAAVGHSVGLENRDGLFGFSSAPVNVKSDFTSQFKDGNESVLLLRGNCEITHKEKTWTAPLMVLWELPDDGTGQKRILAYMETSSEFSAMESSPGRREQRPFLLVDLETSGLVSLQAIPGRDPIDLPQSADDPAYIRARQRRMESRSNLQQTQYTFESAPMPGGVYLPAPAPRIQQRVTISPKFLGGHLEAKGEISEGSIPPEYVVTLTGGVNIVVDNVPLNVGGQMVLSRVDLTADRAVIWTDANHIDELRGFDIDSNTPFQVYLEGSIVVRQGNNDVRATHAFYDVNQRRGLAMNAELRTLLPDLQGTLRLRAAEVRQMSDTNFHAKDAFFTTSEFGKPKYRIQASDVFLEEKFLGHPDRINPVTGDPEGGTFVATSLNNTIFVDDFPIFVAPYLTGPAENPNIPVRKFNVGYSGMFGTTVETVWDLRPVLGLDLPPNVDLQLQADYLSKRGPGGGLRGLFDVDSELFGQPVHQEGWGQAYYINDHGTDNLGLGRRDLPVYYSDNRGRVIFRDRIDLDQNTWLQAEIGHVFNNDRNFDEQYYEYDWDTQKDLENLLTINHQNDNLTLSALGTIKSDGFNDQTNWLPRGDATLLGKQLFDSPVIWNTHSMVGYGQLKPAEAPPDPTLDPFQALPYFTNSEGLVTMTRHELNAPFDVGPVHVVPYAMGELAYWEEDITGDSLGRAYGTAGIKASVEFAKYMPEVRSTILGLNGLAHKVVFDAEYYYAQSSTSLNNVAQYNQFDDNAQERFRERLVPVELNGNPLPTYMDPRYYAVRSGAGRSVTSPYNELVDDQNTLWLGMRHRWQTKVGPAAAPRIIDWMEFDLGTAIFPQANRDNFGETLGLINSRYAWHVSPRTSFLADGVWDVFSGGQRVWNAGVLHQRTARGSTYLGFRQVEVDTIESQLVTGSFSYVLSPNLYVVTAAAQYDVAEGIDRGETFTITRIGEFFLLHLGFGYDRSRDNVGVALSLEPKFGSYGSSSMQLNSLLGIY
ncbi:hypothetical protein SAMN05421753_10768 [Planctomicrobium piriforme]|uniref:LPS-assembly protein LptD n=1 Tax=Planctomicrobium piriforme TaxID=1576369 RepID=A0A1I3GNG7_9PLAN|nr:hypothetical protein SAMN05421753_10768 [Planctomicrobium piriforme]